MINFSKIVYNDLSNIAPEHYTKHITTRLAEIKAVESPADRSAFIQILESTYRFTLGSLAGGKYYLNIKFVISISLFHLYISRGCYRCLSN